MLNRNEIDAEIARLEYEESSYPNYAKLANLYTIRNQMEPMEETTRARTTSVSYAETDGRSDFLKAVSGKESAAAWAIVDELMDTLKVNFPRAYDRVMRKIQEL